MANVDEIIIDLKQPVEKTKATANQIAHHLIVNGKPDGKPRRNNIRRGNNKSTADLFKCKILRTT